MLSIQRRGFQLAEARFLELSSHQFQRILSVALRSMTPVSIPIAQLAQGISQIVHRLPPNAIDVKNLVKKFAAELTVVSVDANSREARSPEGARARRSAEPVASSEASAVPSVESSGGGFAQVEDDADLRG